MESTKLKLTFEIQSEQMSISEINTALELKATDGFSKGDQFRNNKFRQFTSWRYSLGFVDCLDFEQMLDDLIEHVLPHKNDLLQLKKASDVDFMIYSVVEVYDGYFPAIDLDKKHFQFFLDLEIEFLDVDMYGYTNEEL